jgi:excinuclease UvrABC nuclease subunit
MRIFPIYLLPSVPLAHKGQLPKLPGVYYARQWFCPWGRVLYVGESGNLYLRWNSRQYGKHHKFDELRRYPGVRLYYQICADKLDAQRLEARDIAALKPLLNRVKENAPRAPLRDLRDWIIQCGLLGCAGVVAGLILKLITR